MELMHVCRKMGSFCHAQKVRLFNYCQCQPARICTVDLHKVGSILGGLSYLQISLLTLALTSFLAPLVEREKDCRDANRVGLYLPQAAVIRC